MAPLEPWEKVLVDNEKFSQTTHGQQACTDCHAGEQSADKDTAHSGLVARPSENPQKVCGACHEETTASFSQSLHATLQGYWTVLEARSVPENHAALDTMFDNHCAKCHTSCGDCHISQPASVGGGLFSGHVFEKTPPMTRACTACHGSRVGNEFLGKNEELPGDVHFRQGRMNCVKCHTDAELHGQANPEADHRYSGAQIPTCADCHETAASGEDQNPMHQVHGEQMSCQVCHAITYTSCDGCHVAISEKTGNPFFETQATYMTFFIGRNPLKSDQRPYEYVTVRHVPVAETSFQFYGANLLSNFNTLPTWAYATPHNIQRKTPQNASCEACHENTAIFLTADKVRAEELEANQGVIVETLPPSMQAIQSAPVMTAKHSGLISMPCNACHETGSGGAPVNPPDHINRSESACTACHKLP